MMQPTHGIREHFDGGEGRFCFMAIYGDVFVEREMGVEVYAKPFHDRLWGDDERRGVSSVQCDWDGGGDGLAFI